MSTWGKGTLFKIMSTVPVTVAEVTGITPPSPTRETMDNTTLSTSDSYRTFMAGWIDGGECSLSGFYDPTTGKGQTELEALRDSGEVESFAVVYPSGIGKTLTFDGIVTSVAPGVEMDGLISMECTIKVSGKPTMAATV